MAIITVEDPINGGTVTMVEGEVAQISFKEIAGGADKFGNTHRAGVRIDDDWVNNISLKVKEGFDPQVRYNAGTQGKPDWQTLEVGDEVKIVVQPNEYNGKTYYNSGVSKIRLVKKGDGNSSAPNKPSQTSGGSSFQKKDDTPIVAGNARTAAATWLSRIEAEEDFHTLIKFFAETSDKARKEITKNHPDMSAFEVGVSSGQATVAAAQLCDDLSEVFDFILEYVNETIPYSLEIVKSLQAPVEAKPKATKTAGKKAVAKKVVSKKVPVVDAQMDDSDIPDSAFAIEDDLPF